MTRRPLVTAAAVLLAVATGLVVWKVSAGDSGSDAPRVAVPAGSAAATLPPPSTTTSASPDPAPSAPLFPGLTETTLDSTGGTLRVVVADDDAERRQGLRGRSDLGPYDGMLFVFPGSDRVSFTMSTVPVALDIGFYDTALHRVGARRMEPCAGSEAQCPAYPSPAPFVYALETLAGHLPGGDLRFTS